MMTFPKCVMTWILPLLFPTDTPHAANDVYARIIEEGVVLDGQPVKLEPPRLSEVQTAAEQQTALAELAGGKRALADLLRDSVTAPFVLKVRDEDTPNGTIRHADLTFVLHAKLADFRPEQAAKESDGKAVEVANMKLSTEMLDAAALQAVGINDRSDSRWFARSTAEMLDRIRVEATTLVQVSRGERSVVIASQTDRRFHNLADHANAWQALPRRGEPAGPVVPYDGSVSYARITELRDQPNVLVVEAKVAFFEPEGWFDGAAILRSKFAPIAQDQIRRLRRELEKSRR